MTNPLVISDRIYKIISLIVVIFWFIFAGALCGFEFYGQKGSLNVIYHQFAFKSEDERLNIIAPDIYPTIKLIVKNIPSREKLLIISFPYEESYRIGYYLYPRSIYWYEKQDQSSDRAICKNDHFTYCIAFDDAKNPIFLKVNQ